MLYLSPNGAFNLESFIKQLHHFNELLFTVLKAMAKHQGADDVGDSIVKDEVWIEWLTSRIEEKLLCKFMWICSF